VRTAVNARDVASTPIALLATEYGTNRLSERYGIVTSRSTSQTASRIPPPPPAAARTALSAS
jgi:hypothetical protein